MKQGQIVTIQNSTIGGGVFNEGNAELIKNLNRVDQDGRELWVVHFVFDKQGENYNRWVWKQ
jgi:hypothetical protein